MRRNLLCLSLLYVIPALMGADFKATPIQREMVELLGLTVGLELPPDAHDCSFVVTEQVIENMQALKEGGTPIEIPYNSELAAKKGTVLKAMGFIPRKEFVTEQDPYRFDVTDVTLKTLRGMTVTILSDGTVQLRPTR